MSYAVATLKFNTLAFEIYGSQYVARLAEHRDVQLRTVQRWASGAREPPAELLEHLSGQFEMLKNRDVIADLRAVAQQVVDEDGVDPFIVAGILERLSAEMRGKPDAHLGSGRLKIKLSDQDSDDKE